MYVPEDFVHSYPPQRVHFGPGGARRLASLLEERGLRRCVIICGAHVGAAPWLEALITGAGGRIVEVYRGVRPHAPTETVDAAADLARALEADGLVSVGGGSAHDTMRAVALCLRTGRRMVEHFPAGQAFVRDPPDGAGGPGLIAVPSTLSAAETTFGGGVVAAGRKLVFVGETLYISDVVLDPDVFATTPLETLLATGMNAVNHATERLVSPRHQPIADAQFLHALRLLVPALRRLAAGGPGDDEALVGCMLGAHLSESTNVLGGIGHAIAHVLGGRYGVSHGVANGIVMPRALLAAAARSPGPVSLIAQTLGAPDDPKELERFFVQFVAGLGLPTCLKAIGVPRSDLPAIVADTLDDFSAADPARGITARSVRALLERAYLPTI